MITLTVDPNRSDNPVAAGLYVLTKLRDAGVPVVGTLWPMGVESGTLTIGEVDICDGSVAWVWKP